MRERGKQGERERGKEGEVDHMSLFPLACRAARFELGQRVLPRIHVGEYGRAALDLQSNR